MSNKSYKWKHKLHEIIYEADTKAGKLFDVVLLIIIVLSVLLAMLESVEHFSNKYALFFDYTEWVITILFSLEYLARILVVNKPIKYITSFYGIIDLLATLPKYISILVSGTQVLVVLRALRLLRVFRILKLAHYLGASNHLIKAIKNSKAKIAVFLYAVIIISIIFGTLRYVVEGEENGFTSIPKSIYWCIVTLTTVGFGDITPITPIGQFIASAIMVLGYGIIAVPTGIVSAEYIKSDKDNFNNTDNDINLNSQHCSNCSVNNHSDDAKFCYKCGSKLHYE